MKLAAAFMSALSLLTAAVPRYSVTTEPAGGSGSPRVIVLRDNFAGVEAAIAPGEGGELSSFAVRFGGKWIELIYRAREYGPTAGFRGKAPVLWPAVGGQYLPGAIPANSCSDGEYAVGRRTYPMPCHGFASGLPWQEVSSSATDAGAAATLELRDSPQTRAMYPFGFLLRVTYTLVDGRLRIKYDLAASRDIGASMPFSIGNHVTFRVPFLQGTGAGDMLFETNCTYELLRDSHGLVTTASRPRSFAIPQRLGDFDATVAIPLAGYTGAPAARLADPQGLAVRISHNASSSLPEPLVQFNLYGGPAQGFFSPEPWFGVQNSLNTGTGLVRLAPGAGFQWTIELQPEVAREKVRK